MSALSSPGESVPVSERLRVLQWVRAAAVGLVLLCAALAPEVVAPGRRQVVATTLAYAGVVLAGEVLARLWRRRLVLVFGALLIGDGLWLAWAGYLTGAGTSPLRYLVLLHVGAVALVASYRTGMKLALWHSLLLVLLENGVRSGTLTATATGSAVDPLRSGPVETERLVVFVVVLWLVALSTSALSAFNERELRRRRYDLEALTRLAEQLEKTGDSASVARTLLDAVTEVPGFGRGVVLAGPEGQLGVLASRGLDPDVARAPGRPGPSAVVERAQQLRSPLLVRGVHAGADAWLDRLLPGVAELVVVPLLADDRPVGALVLERGDGPGRGRVPRRVLDGLERSAAYATLALRNAWLLEQLKRLASTDGLTKIANRRTFEATLEREVARGTRSGEPLSLVMLDIDHFKRLNDEQGHQAGDEVLRNVAAALSCECRDFDTPARYGGEEFAVVLPGCGPDEAQVIAERLRRAVASAPAAVAVTASAGVASFPAHAGGADALVKAADDALYASKHAGRDRTTLSAAEPGVGSVEEVLRRAVAARLAVEPAQPATG